MRKTCLAEIYKLAQKDERVIFIGSDLSPNLLAQMRENFPDRYYMEGICEAALVGMAAGMALNGFIPYLNTISTFLTRRSYEQIAVDVCLHDLPVRLVGNGGGYVYAPLGPTHQAIEDVCIMRALPNMTVVSVCDAHEMTRLMQASLLWKKPMYIRLAKGGDLIVSREDLKFEIGKGIVLFDSYVSRYDLVVFSTGVATAEALMAVERLVERGFKLKLVHLHTIKPLDSELVVRSVLSTRHVLTVEEHSLIGGLGSAVIETIVEELKENIPCIKRIGIADHFSKNYGSQKELMSFNGITSREIYQTAVEIINNKAE